MTNFDRGLDNEFVKALNDEYNKEGSWWRNLVDDRELFIAIRNNYLNVYYRGGSVLKLNWLPSERKMIGEIHYKYLLKPSMPRKDQLIKIEDGRPILPPDPECLFLDGLDDVGGLKNAVRCYTGAEKEGIHAFVFRDKNPDVVDLEIAIDDGKGRKQIDLAAIHDIDRSGSFKLVFYEVKHFGNKELRTKTGTIPVVDQMSRYSEAIAQNHDELVDSYRKVCGNLSELEGVVVQQDRKKWLRAISTGSVELLIEDQPRLIVFGFDQDQRDGSIWGPHAKRLEDELTKERILFVGNPKNIKLDGR